MTGRETDDLMIDLHALMSETRDGGAYEDPRSLSLIATVRAAVAKVDDEGTDPCAVTGCDHPYDAHPQGGSCLVLLPEPCACVMYDSGEFGP